MCQLENLERYFPNGARDDYIYILVTVLQEVRKRDRDEEDSDNTGRAYTIEDAFRKARLANKSLVDGEADLPLLSLKERAKVLSYIGKSAKNNMFRSIPAAASVLRTSKTKVQDKDVMTAPKNKEFPLVETTGLFARAEYCGLYDDNASRFNRSKKNAENRIVVAGTPGVDFLLKAKK
ncbi:hypothetical protein BGX26_008849 [Mortierella sp. AD094]|nr:hypothetical protein BGX26_008849 [Mortierella sp. AD094]